MKKIVLLCSFFGLSVMGVCKYNSSHAALSDLQLENINAISRAIDDGDGKKTYNATKGVFPCTIAIGTAEIKGLKAICSPESTYVDCPDCMY